MDELKKAKEKYSSIEIPPELNTVVRSAIENRKEKKKNLFVLRQVLPIAACLAIVAVAAFTGIHGNINPVSSEGTISPAPAAMARSLPRSMDTENKIEHEFFELGKLISTVADSCEIEQEEQIMGK